MGKMTTNRKTLSQEALKACDLTLPEYAECQAFCAHKEFGGWTIYSSVMGGVTEKLGVVETMEEAQTAIASLYAVMEGV